MVEIIRAETAGFCMGVDLALRKLDRAIRKNVKGQSIYTLGPIIHNPQVLASHAARGVKQAEDYRKVPTGSKVLIRAHGIPQHILKYLKDKDVQVVDATCPKVRKAQQLISEQSSLGRCLLLLGELEHPEVVGLLSYALKGAIVFESLNELQKSQLDLKQQYFLAAQTTQNRREYKAVAKYLRTVLSTEIPVFDTICDTTKQRQEEAVRISRSVDLMVVVGGYESGNTRRLAQIVASEGIDSVHIQEAEDLQEEVFANKKKIGITAGASTPGWVIKEVEGRIRQICNS